MNSKIIIPVTGSISKYRLEIMKQAYPDMLDYVILFTDKFSYDLYTDYHDVFNFILMDDYQDSFSKRYELFPQYKTEKEYLEKITTFEGAVSPDISRFIFKYLIENNILNFVITETDFILKNDEELLHRFFSRVPPGTLYMPIMGDDNRYNDTPLWSNIQHLFPGIDLKYKQPLRMCDGFLRGFHFNNKEEMSLFYKIYCEAIKDPILTKLINYTGTKLYYCDYVVYSLMQIFEKQKQYAFKDIHDFTSVDGQDVGKHVCRPEDTFYSIKSENWELVYNLRKGDATTISEYIQKNKAQLKNYYEAHGYRVEATDTHIFTYVK